MKIKPLIYLKILGNDCRAPIDSESAVTIINKEIVERFPSSELLRSTEVTLHSAFGNAIVYSEHGEITCEFSAWETIHPDTVLSPAENVTQCIIIGRDCLQSTKQR